MPLMRFSISNTKSMATSIRSFSSMITETPFSLYHFREDELMIKELGSVTYYLSLVSKLSNTRIKPLVSEMDESGVMDRQLILELFQQGVRV